MGSHSPTDDASLLPSSRRRRETSIEPSNFMEQRWLQSSSIMLHAPSDWSAVFHFATPLTDLRVPMHAPSNGSAVFHFAAL